MESSASFNNIFSNEPWLTIEEFNVIAHPSKSLNECQEFNSNIRDFIVSRFQIFVFDHAFLGFLFFTQSQVEFLPLGISYHYLALYSYIKKVIHLQSLLNSSIIGLSTQSSWKLLSSHGMKQFQVTH